MENKSTSIIGGKFFNGVLGLLYLLIAIYMFGNKSYIINREGQMTMLIIMFLQQVNLCLPNKKG